MMPYRRARTSQPQSPVELDPYWVSRGLVLVIDRDFYVTPSGCGRLGVGGSPKLLPQKDGILGAYGTTLAGNTNSWFTGPTLGTPKRQWRSYIARFYAISYGGGNVGRLWQAQTGNSADGTSANAEAIYLQGATNNRLLYSRFATPGYYNQYLAPRAQEFNKWMTVGFTHGQSAGSILPVGYYNGLPDGNWSQIVDNGAYIDPGTTAIAVGNRPSDGSRGWDGYIGYQLFFDGYLSPQDHLSLAANPNQVYRSRTFFLGSLTAPQILYPTGDVAGGTWLPSTGTDLFACIDETVASESATESNMPP